MTTRAQQSNRCECQLSAIFGHHHRPEDHRYLILNHRDGDPFNPDPGNLYVADVREESTFRPKISL